MQSLKYYAWLLASALTFGVSSAIAVPHTLPSELAAPGSPVLVPKIGGDVFGEGVIADWDGTIYNNQMGTNNRTMQLKVGQDTSKPWRTAKDAPNGMWLDTKNRIVICQTRAMVRVKAGSPWDGMTDTLYKYPAGTGQDFNDVTGDSKDNLYFTNYQGRSVYYLDGETGQTKVVLSGRPFPNGIEWDEERNVVYVAENETGKVAAYTVAGDHTLVNRKEFATVAGSDGTVIDELGNLYVVSGGVSAMVFKPDGTKLGEIPIPNVQFTNLAFGGADFKTLYMIGNKGLYKLPMKVKGYKTGAPVVSIGRRSAKPLIYREAQTYVYLLDGRHLSWDQQDRPLAPFQFVKP